LGNTVLQRHKIRFEQKQWVPRYGLMGGHETRIVCSFHANNAAVFLAAQPPEDC